MPRITRGGAIEDNTDVILLANRYLELEIAVSFGPRVTRFAKPGGPNALVDLGDMAIELPDGRSYRLRGGHRLWIAPEIPAISYEPDDKPVVIATGPGSVVATQPAATNGVEKSLEVSLEERSVSLLHTLTNRSNAPLDIAPWAITQLPVGGTAIVPLNRDPSDAARLQPNSSIVVWPYTGVNDSPFTLDNRLLLLDADRDSPTKVGTALDRGWLAYVRHGLVFVKRAERTPGGRYLDMNASGQCYCSADFVELETLGEQTLLEPDASTTHAETWDLHEVDPAIPANQIPELLDLDGGTSL